MGGGARGFIPLKGKNVGVETPTYKKITSEVEVGWAFSPTKSKLGATHVGVLHKHSSASPLPFGGVTHVDKFRNYRKTAFTLAEVLITLGIIGVVAAMTLPTLIQKQNEREVVSKLKKVYSTLSQAYLFATEANGPIEDWGFLATDGDGLGAAGDDLDHGGANNPLNHETVAKKFMPYLKVVKDCKDGQSQSGPCKITSTSIYRVILNDGTLLSFKIYAPRCDKDFNAGTSRPLSNVCGYIEANIRYRQNKNYYGKNVFNFYMTKYGIIPYGTSEDKNSFEQGCSANGDLGNFTKDKYVSCAAWVLINENMDYLKCEGLSWNGKKKCSD